MWHLGKLSTIHCITGTFPLAKIRQKINEQTWRTTSIPYFKYPSGVDLVKHVFIAPYGNLMDSDIPQTSQICRTWLRQPKQKLPDWKHRKGARFPGWLWGWPCCHLSFGFLSGKICISNLHSTFLIRFFQRKFLVFPKRILWSKYITTSSRCAHFMRGPLMPAIVESRPPVNMDRSIGSAQLSASHHMSSPAACTLWTTSLVVMKDSTVSFFTFRKVVWRWYQQHLLIRFNYITETIQQLGWDLFKTWNNDV